MPCLFLLFLTSKVFSVHACDDIKNIFFPSNIAEVEMVETNFSFFHDSYYSHLRVFLPLPSSIKWALPNACEKGHAAVVQLLLDKGADVKDEVILLVR